MKIRSSTKTKFRQIVQYVPAEKEELKYAEVVSRVGKWSGQYKNWFHVQGVDKDGKRMISIWN